MNTSSVWVMSVFLKHVNCAEAECGDIYPSVAPEKTQKLLVEMDTNKMLIQSRLDPSLQWAWRGPLVPTTHPCVCPSGCWDTKSVQPSHWTVFVCLMHAIHVLIKIYANTAEVPRQRGTSALLFSFKCPTLFLFVFLMPPVTVGTNVGTA